MGKSFCFQFSNIGSNQAVGLSSEESAEASALAGSGFFRVDPGFYELRAQGRLPNRPGQREIRCVLEPSSFRFVEWHEN